MGSVSPSLPVFVVWVGRRAWWVTGQSLPPAPSPPSLLPIHLPAVQLRRRWRRPTRLPALAKGRHQGLFFVVAQRPGAGIRDCLSLVVQRPRACIRNCFLVVRRPWAGIRGWFFWSCKCHGQAWSCKDHGQALGVFVWSCCSLAGAGGVLHGCQPWPRAGIRDCFSARPPDIAKYKAWDFILGDVV